MDCGLGVGCGPPEGMTSWPHGPPRWEVRLDESQAGTPLRNGRDAEATGCGGGASVDPVCSTNGSGRKGWEAWELCGLPHLTHTPPCEMPHKACVGSQDRSLEEVRHRILHSRSTEAFPSSLPRGTVLCSPPAKLLFLPRQLIFQWAQAYIPLSMLKRGKAVQVEGTT